MRLTFQRWARVFLSAAALVIAPRPSFACAGDCNGDGTVTIDELLRAVRIALNDASVDTCDAADNNLDGKVTVDDLVLAVGKALQGCGSGPATDWPMYGHDLRHSFTAVQAAVDNTNVASLQLVWKVPMPDAVSAPPSVVSGAVYIGAWDGVMSALDADSGAVRWTFEVDCQNAILPIPPRCLAPGQQEPDRIGTDGG
jgi:outer membrane protein assembly factor BamB